MVSEDRTAGNAISRMPKAVRDQVSRALEDGADWKAVRDICKTAGFPGVRPQNVTNYRKKSHQEWLAKEERMAAIRRDSEATGDMVRFYVENGGSPAEAGLLAGAEMLSKAIAGMGPESLLSLAADDPKSVLAMMRELARVAELLRAKTQDLKTQDPKEAAAPTLTPEQRAAAMKEIFGLPA